jgi:DHA1 family bicyclomycin/chloramphenicol resistance-like MFS transporter
LIAITTTGPLTMQMYAPLVPTLREAFATSLAAAQLGLSLAYAMFSLATLLYGPLSDHFGRRPVLLLGTAIFCVGGALCTLAPGIEWLIAGRVAQAVGAGAGMVLARAIVRDLCDRDQSAAMIAYITMGMVLAPMFAPMAGGILSDLFTWRGMFAFTLIYGLAVLAMVALLIPETAPGPMKRQADGLARPAITFRNWRREAMELVSLRQFWGYVLQVAFLTSMFFTIVASTPHLMIDRLGYTATEFGVWFTLMGGTYIVGNYLAAKLTPKVGGDRMIRLGLALNVPILVVGLIIAWAGALGPILIMALPALGGIGNGLAVPNGQAGAVDVNPRLAGTAAGLATAIPMMLAAGVMQLMSYLQDGTALPMYAVMSVCLCLSWLSFGLANGFLRAR